MRYNHVEFKGTYNEIKLSLRKYLESLDIRIIYQDKYRFKLGEECSDVHNLDSINSVREKMILNALSRVPKKAGSVIIKYSMGKYWVYMDGDIFSSYEDEITLDDILHDKELWER